MRDLMEQEAMLADDILWRRTKCGLKFNREQVEQYAELSK